MDDEIDRQKEYLNTLTLDELVKIALKRNVETDLDEFDPGWEAVWILRRRGTPKIFERAKAMVYSASAPDRALAADIFAIFNDRSKNYFDEREHAIIHLLDTDSDELVIESALFAMGHMVSEAAVPYALRYISHSNECVRFAAACGLSIIDIPEAIAALITLSADSDEDVRNWATFGLGNQCESDSPEIRAALMARVEDPNEHGDAYWESLFGLAKRGDPRAYDYLLKAIEANNGNGWVFEGAELLGDIRLLAPLEKLNAEHGSEYAHHLGLDDAIAALRVKSGNDLT
jgi:HEAT repeat protein